MAPARRLVHRIRACSMRSPICPQADSIELEAIGQPRLLYPESFNLSDA